LQPAHGAAAEAKARSILKMVLPVASAKTVGIYASAQAIEHMVSRLRAHPLTEVQELGKDILEIARTELEPFLRDADKSSGGAAEMIYRNTVHTNVKEIAAAHLQENYAAPPAPIQLTHVTPRNELDLVTDMLYEQSSLAYNDIKSAVMTWPYSRRLDVFEFYIGNRANRHITPGRALEKAAYTWDLLTSYSVFRDLQRHRIVSNLQRQQLTPRYGYDVPQVIEDAELSDTYEQCFDISLQLYSLLQKAGYTAEAQYATLSGHRVRWTVTYNAREAFHIHELRTSDQADPATRAVVEQMHAKLAEVHPLLAESMRFVSPA
jgi:thymidylate synthase ThyX